MKKALLIPIFLILAITNISAQFYTAQNKVWACGQAVGLNFNSGTAVPFTTSINTYESSASVCNASGNLLFYTDGKKVYNKLGSLMPSGASIVPYTTISTQQGSIIMPVIGDTNKYYIFSLQNYEDTDAVKNKLSYSVVDMSLSGGLGDVVAPSSGTFMYDHLSEGMVAVTGNNNNIWLVSHRNDTSVFVAFNVTSAGVSGTPVLSSPGSPISCAQGGTIRASHNRRRIAMAGYNCMDKVTLYDFDPTTGVISNQVAITTPGPTYNYGIEFSPDNTKLYIGTNYGSTVSIKQYNISTPTTSAILASEVTITDSAGYGALRLAPDGKIYFPNTQTHSIGRINAPNNSGLACASVNHAIVTVGTVTLGLPPIYVTTDTNFSWVPPTEVSEISSKNEVFLFPNPSSSQLTISFSEKITSVKISNLVGQEMAVCNGNGSEKIEINIATLPKGVYVVRVNETALHRFVKE